MIETFALATHPAPAAPPYPSFDVQVYSRWFTRGGDNAVFAAQLSFVYAAEVTIEVFHKNRGDVGNGTSMAGSLSLTAATKFAYAEWLAMKEFVRFRISITPPVGIKGSPVGKALIRFLQPVWFETVKA